MAANILGSQLGVWGEYIGLGLSKLVLVAIYLEVLGEYLWGGGGGASLLRHPVPHFKKGASKPSKWGTHTRFHGFYPMAANILGSQLGVWGEYLCLGGVFTILGY